MIAKNYIRYPEALRFQREMFSNGYHNSPRIMRLMEAVFEWTPNVPEWVQKAQKRAKALAKAVRQACMNWIADLELLSGCKPTGQVEQRVIGKVQTIRFDHIRMPIRAWSANMQTAFEYTRLI